MNEENLQGSLRRLKGTRRTFTDKIDVRNCVDGTPKARKYYII